MGPAAHAANTSTEVLADTDDDGVGDAREFGGRDRYDTALRLARNFAQAKGGLEQVPVASGESLADAVAVSGLAGLLDAPVLLTPPDRLHGAAADFIEDYGIDTLWVLGGEAAVSVAVFEKLEALDNGPAVARIAGADRYGTAAAIASELAGASSWCGGDEPAAILVGGDDASLADAIAVGPIAYRLQLPVLLTASAGLSAETTALIRSHDIEHVVIVGGTASVSTGVESELTAAGVDKVTRLAGADAAATSVMLAELATDGCNDDLAPVDRYTVALVQRDALADGVAAAPVLASTFSGAGLMPILVVGDTLPAAVRNYLAATPEEDSDRNKAELAIVAIGGASAVSDAVMEAALAAAATAPELTVSITSASGDLNEDGDLTNDMPQAEDNRFVLRFNDKILPTDDALEPVLRDILEVNGAPARLRAENAILRADGGCPSDSVDVALANPLKAGDTISIVGGAKLGTPPDQRTLRATSVTVPAPAVDRTRPVVNAIGIVGHELADVSVDEENLPADFVLSLDDVDLVTTSGNEFGDLVWTPGHASGRLQILAADSVTPAPLGSGDRITIRAGAVTDTDGNKSVQRTFSATEPPKSPRVTSVQMSDPNHSNRLAAELPAELLTVPNEQLVVVALKGGLIDGAVSNEWSVMFDVASTYSADQPVDIDVRVNSRDKLLFIRFVNGEATFADLKAALEANSAFAEHFEAGYVRRDDCSIPVDNKLAIQRSSRQVTAAPGTVGTTQVAIEVRFSGYVAQVNTGELLNDVFGATLKRNGIASLADLLSATTTLVRDDGTLSGVAESSDWALDLYS